jgi:hypothetical protein
VADELPDAFILRLKRRIREVNPEAIPDRRSVGGTPPTRSPTTSAAGILRNGSSTPS